MATVARPIDPKQFLEKCVAESQKRPTLRLGASGAQVQAWQTLMQAQMAPSLKIDGMYGPATQAVTAKFQAKSKMAADGIVGPRTWAAASVAACYAAVVQAQKLGPYRGGLQLAQTLENQRKAAAMRGLGALDLSFSVVDPKSMILGVVLGVAAGAVLFRKK